MLSSESNSNDKQSKSRRLKRRLTRLLSSKMTASSYERMDTDAAAKKKKNKKAKVEDIMDKENNNLKDVKAKKKRSWKRFRQAALTTCRYIGLGVAHMSPATVYSASDYYMDPKYWDKSFSSSYKHRPQNVEPNCWTSSMMFTAGSGW